MASSTTTTTVEMRRLCHWSLYLAEQAGRVVRDIVGTGQLGVVDKGDAATGGDWDPQTEADRRAQALIVGNLRARFPGVVVIGEEDQDDERLAHDHRSIVDAPLPPLASDYFAPALWPSATPLGDDVAIGDVCVWVDPLDGTTDLTKGNTDAVTVLIGVAVRGEPVFGVIHAPFGAPRTLYGAVEHARGVQGIAAGTCQASARKGAEQNRIVTSASHHDRVVEAFFANLSPAPGEVVRAGGCGNKIWMVVDGRADAYVYPRAGTKKWDTCAGDAIVRCIGGRISDVHGRALRYDRDADRLNGDGIVVTWRADHSLYTSASIDG